MADTYSLENLLNTTDGTTKVNTSVIQGTLEIEGVSWYLYAGKNAEKIYVHGSGSLGFGEDTDHLKMFYGNSEISRLYRQEGSLVTGNKFLKLRIEGTYYSSTSYKYIYEVFLFDDGNIYIYTVQRTQDKYNNLYGACSITDGKTTKTVLSRSDSAPAEGLISNIGIKMTMTYERYVPIKETGVRVKTSPATVYPPNTLDWSGLTVESYDTSGNTNIVSNFTLPDIDVSTIGTKTVNLTYKTYTIPVEITVKNDAVSELTDIYLRDHYLLNENIEVTSVKAVWESGKTETLKEGFEITGFNSTTSGTKELTFSYKGTTAVKSVYIADTAMLELTDSVQTNYYIGDTFQNAYCKITYDDGYTEYTNTECSGYDMTVTGKQIITATVRGLSTTYTVNVSGTYSADISSTTEATVTAELDLITGILTISGTGNTKEISSPSWGTGGIFDDGGSGQSEKIRKVIVVEGITGLIGACFYGLNRITEVTLPSSLLRIGNGCFESCSGISKLELPENVNYIGTSAFYGCPDLVLTVLGKNVSIEDDYNTMRVKTIRGHINSTAESYAEKYSIPFEIIDKVSKIEITSYPSRGYHIGESVDKSDLTVKITLEDGTEQETDSYELEYDFSTTGAKTVTVSLGGQTASFTVNVTAYKLSELINTTDGMEVIRNNSKNDDNTDTVDGVSWFKFNNVTADKLYINGNNWIGFGISTQQLKICNRDGAIWYIYRLETTLDNGVKLFKIRVEGYTYYSASGTHESQIKYELFLFGNGDMYLNVIKSPASSSSYAGTSSLISGKTTNLSLNGATGENPVQVSFVHQDESGIDWYIAYRAYKFETITGIGVITLPAKTTYKINEIFDSTGITVALLHDDGDPEIITDYTLSAPDMSVSGTKTITVTYESFTATFEIVVIEATGIEATILPDKVRYYEDDAFLLDGLTVSQVYTDGSRETISGYVLSTPDMSTGGSKTITVAYNDFTTTFEITVIGISGIEITKPPAKTEYYTGDSLDVTGLTVMLKYADGANKSLTDYKISGFDSTESGEKTVTLTYKTYTAAFKVTVYSVSGIRIAKSPDKIFYKIGETLDLSGISVVLIRNDGTEKEVTGYETSGFDSSKAGTKTVTVFYNRTVNGVSVYVGSDTFQVKVTKDGKNPFDGTEPVSVTVHWPNREFKDLTSENNSIKASTLILQESICAESYFIFGGCVSNQITFEADHEQFYGTDEESYPRGEIEVYLECAGTEVKIFTGEIESAERKTGSMTRSFVAYDYLYKAQNIDITWWYKNITTDKHQILTQKQFRDSLFSYLGIKQVETALPYDNAYVPNTQNANEMKAANILKDLCLQNNRFGRMTRDGKFEYLKLNYNSYRYGTSNSGKAIYKYYNNAEIHLDTFKSFWAKEGQVWFPYTMLADPNPSRAYGFTQGGLTAQEAYENNVYYNRNSFFIGNEDWLNYVWDADEYGGITRSEPIMDICYGTFVDLNAGKFYRAQAYTVEVEGNPLNLPGQSVELHYVEYLSDGTELEWNVHSYIVSRTLKLGNSKLIDTYSAKNAPYNGNTRQLGNNTPEISATVNKTRAEMPVISYEFSDGSSEFTTQSTGSGSKRKLVQLRCIKQIKLEDYENLSEEQKKNGTIFMTHEEI